MKPATKRNTQNLFKDTPITNLQSSKPRQNEVKAITRDIYSNNVNLNNSIYHSQVKNKSSDWQQVAKPSKVLKRGMFQNLHKSSKIKSSVKAQVEFTTAGNSLLPTISVTEQSNSNVDTSESSILASEGTFRVNEDKTYTCSKSSHSECEITSSWHSILGIKLPPALPRTLADSLELTSTSRKDECQSNLSSSSIGSRHNRTLCEPSKVANILTLSRLDIQRNSKALHMQDATGMLDASDVKKFPDKPFGALNSIGSVHKDNSAASVSGQVFRISSSGSISLVEDLKKSGKETAASQKLKNCKERNQPEYYKRHTDAESNKTFDYHLRCLEHLLDSQSKLVLRPIQPLSLQSSERSL